MKRLLFLLVSASVCAVEPNEAFKKLLAGNDSFVNHHLVNQKAELSHQDLLKGQAPFAIILSCSDSRAPPEILFDQSVGDLFVVRVAGNVLGKTELDSIEYGVLHLGAPLIVVLGHENCGAVAAVLAGKTKDIPTVASLIAPAVKDGDSLEDAVIANVCQTVDALEKKPEFAALISQGKLKVVGGYYHLTTGIVRFL